MNIKEILESFTEYFRKVDKHEKDITELNRRLALLEKGKSSEALNDFAKNDTPS